MVKRVIALISLIVLLIVLMPAFFYFEMNRPLKHETATFVVHHGMPMVMISEQLSRAGVIKHPFVFSAFARMIGVDRKLRAGEYELEGGLTMMNVLNMLKEGKCKLYKAVLIEGWTGMQMAEYLSAQPFAWAGLKDEFVKLFSDRNLAVSLEIDAPTLEGYLFPDTYMMERPNSAYAMISMLVAEFKKNYTPELAARAAGMGMNRNQVLTLASIIEKEAGNDEERPLVSSVFHNRLKKGMPLQADPTVIYAIKDYDGNIRKSDLSNPSPYNTYVHAGLPPGPICNPGIASIKAALWPASTNYLYFVSRNDGTHEFNENYSDHAKAVIKYQSKR